MCKARTVELVGGNYLRSVDNEGFNEVGDRTLGASQRRYGKPCALLVVNDDIAAEGQLISNDMPRLHYSGWFTTELTPNDWHFRNQCLF
jgi:hypothetical protein